jgi:hypothetical protein
MTKLTIQQVTLLLELRDSKARGAASMSCGGFRMSDSTTLVEKGFAEQHRFGSTFFVITDAGIEEAKKFKSRPTPEKEHVREKSSSEVVTGRWEKDSRGKWIAVPHDSR